MFDKVKQFLIERAKWKKAGSPNRTNDEVKEIFDICNKCPEYKKRTEREGNCGVCGCRITMWKTYRSKNTWATTRCPLENPKWIERLEYQNLEVSEEEIKAEEEAIKIEQEQPGKTAPVKKKGCGCAGKKS